MLYLRILCLNQGHRLFLLWSLLHFSFSSVTHFESVFCILERHKLKFIFSVDDCGLFSTMCWKDCFLPSLNCHWMLTKVSQPYLYRSVSELCSIDLHVCLLILIPYGRLYCSYIVCLEITKRVFQTCSYFSGLFCLF